MTPPTLWPVLSRYDQDHLARIALPLGGIGTGTVSLGGRGDLRDWEIVNRPAKGWTPPQTFFALWAKPQDGAPIARCLEGPLEPTLYEGGFGSPASNHGLPRFRQCAFEAAYPLGQVLLSDLDVPVSVRLQAFNPFVPNDADRSGIPIAVLRFVLTNETDEVVEAAVCGSVQNFIGMDGTNGTARGNGNTIRTADGLTGIFLRPGETLAPSAEQWGTMALAALDAPDATHRTAWAARTWGDSLLDFWDDFSADGRLDERDGGGADAPVASVAAPVTVPPRGEASVTFLLAWHFPNRQTWSPAPETNPECCADGEACGDPNWVGNFYATRFRDAWEVAVQTAAALPALEADTVAFVNAFCQSDLPHAVKEAALFNLSTLRSQTCFRTADGHFFGWEGCGDKAGCCDGSCTHVWNYEQATAFLFPALARDMRAVEFLHATDPDTGRMSFRVHLPLPRAREWPTAAADGQMGCLMKLYRDWTLCGDDAWLRSLWPLAKKTLEFCWIDDGWDADRDGVMEGCQHNTMDVEYYGPNPQMGTWYLGALRACEEMARRMDESEFADECRRLFESGSRWLDAHLFNGEYYEHEIRPIGDAEKIALGLRHTDMGAKNLADPELQLGAGCLIDQLVGQYFARVCNLGTLLDENNVRATLGSLMRYNFQPDLHAHFNHLRTFALGDEAAMLMATYPKGRRPARPFPYYNEVMTGFEYTAAAGMLYEGKTDDGLRVIEAIRARYDGRRRSPFDEAECGHHYARAMASWAAVLALTGFAYFAPEQRLTFAPAETPTRWFWSSGAAWGTCAQQPREDGIVLRLSVDSGTLALRDLHLRGFGMARLPQSQTLTAGTAVDVLITRAN